MELRFISCQPSHLEASEDTDVASVLGSVEDGHAVLLELSVEEQWAEELSHLPGLIGLIPTEEKAKIEVAGMVNVAVVVLRHNRRAQRRDLVKDVVDDNQTDVDADSVGNTLHLGAVLGREAVEDGVVVLVDDREDLGGEVGWELIEDLVDESLDTAGKRHDDIVPAGGGGLVEVDDVCGDLAVFVRGPLLRHVALDLLHACVGGLGVARGHAECRSRRSKGKHDNKQRVHARGM